MSAEPALAHAAILDALRSAYGLELDQITFLEDGTAHAYRVSGVTGQYFLKILPDTAYGQTAIQRVLAEIPLLTALREQHILSRVPRPVVTPNREASVHIGQFQAVLYEWIEAVNLSDQWEAALPQLVPLLGRLHAGTAQLGHLSLPTPPEDFDLPFEAELQADLEHLRGDGSHRPALQELRDLLLPHDETLQRLLAQARHFQQNIRNREHEFVVCHTDAHGGNVMRNAAGELWIIDWETARLAPAEHDLWSWGMRLPELLPLYEAAHGQPFQPDLDVLGFYFYRRVLEDLAMDVAWIMRENTHPEQDEHNLMIIRQYVIPALMSTESTFGEVAAQLKG